MQVNSKSIVQEPEAASVPPFTPETPVFDEIFGQQLKELFRYRRDVRHFKEIPVPNELIKKAIEMAFLAPSVGLSEPWRYVWIESPDTKRLVAEEFERANFEASKSYDTDIQKQYLQLKLAGLKVAPVHIAVFECQAPTQGKGLGRQTMPETTLYSVMASIQNLWLACTSVGLGMGWVSILDPSAITKILDIDPTWRLVAYLCIGWPAIPGAVPELERAGWEKRHDPSEKILRR
ncbi:MAG: 5,6-dimethylbenzimidazole synthase [Pirellula sp.]|jgi:5,6-dimethylbenzimidazole synthase